jgi:hypothetical protein
MFMAGHRNDFRILRLQPLKRHYGTMAKYRLPPLIALGFQLADERRR